jgi:hypothetical protein
MASEYKSPFSVSKRQTIFIDSKDPRVRDYQAALTAARAGAEIVIVNGNGGSLLASSFAANTINRQSSTASGTPVAIEGKTPSVITNLAATWQEFSSGPALVFTFDIDLTSTDNDGVDSFRFTLSDGTVTTPTLQSAKLNKTSAAQEIIFYYADNAKYFGIFQTTFTQFTVSAHDKGGNIGPFAILTNIPVYVADLCTPTITVSSIPMGYSVALTDVCTKPYEFISVEEIVSSASTAPTTGYQQVYLSNIKPANIVTPTTETRWVKARYTSKSGVYGPYSNPVQVTPTNPISVDLIPPAEVTAVSAAWSGDNLVISYTLPTSDAGVRFKVALTAPNSAVGYFYAFPVPGTLNQTLTISKDDLFFQFQTHYSSYTGLIKSIDSADNQSAGVAFTVPVRSCSLTGVVPTFTSTALVNGYSVSFSLPLNAVYAEIYQKYTSWSGVTPVDSFTGSYASGGAAGTNTVTLSSVISNKGVTVSPLVGYRVIGEGIPNNTYITAVSGNQITVNNNFTSQVSGSVTGYAIVYSGSGPANITSTIYANTYLLVRFYDDFECASSYSEEQIVLPLSPVTVDISGPGDVATVNTPTSGIDTSGTLGFNGYINLTWTAVSDTTLRGYRIRFTTDTVSADPAYEYVDYPVSQSNPPTGTLSYKLSGLAVGATYKIGIATYDQYNNTSSSYTNFSNATISGTPAITDYITAGSFQFGQGVDPSNTTGITGMKRGLFFDDSNYWFLNSSDSARLKVGGSTSNYLLWNGTKFTVDGDITARGGSFSGNIALTTAGASIYSGDVTTSPGNLTGDGFIFNKDGILIRKGTNQVSLDTTTGSVTANAGNIAGWTIDSSKIERQDPSSTKWAGLSSTGTYKFWAGSTVSTGDTTQFAVDNTGKVYTSNIQISGGSIDVGAGPSVATPGTGSSGGNTVSVSSASGISSGMLVFGTGIASGAVVSSVSGTTITLNKANTGSVSGSIRFVPASGAHITSSGDFYVANGNLNGNITAKSGTIEGNFQVVSGSFYTGTSPTETSVIINDKGLASIGTSNATLTAILNTPITSGNIPLGNQPSVGNLPSQITFFTKAALIGGWVVNDTSIRDRSQQFILDSDNKRISITGVIDVSTNYAARFGTDNYNSTTASYNIIEAGITGLTPNFYVTRSGTLYATGAVISGNVVITSGTTYNQITQAENNATAANNNATIAVNTAAGKAKVFRQDNEPTALAQGDIWIDTNDSNKMYVASGAGTGVWVLSQDSATAQAAAIAAASSASIANSRSQKLDSVTGDLIQGLTLTTAGSIYANKSSYTNDTTTGWYIGWRSIGGGSFTPAINIGGSNAWVKWDGNALDVKGDITATTMTSTGSFSFASGILSGTASSVTINGGNLVLTDSTGGDDGTAGDPTVTRIINPGNVGGVPDGKIVTGRAIWYGGNNTPTNSITSRYAFNNTFGATQGYYNGQPRYTSSNPGNFSTGDLYMTIV